MGLKLTRKSKIVIAVVAPVVVILAAFLVLPPLRTMVFGGPILKYGGAGMAAAGGGIFELYCNNGTVFYETTDYTGKKTRKTYYYGQLSPADMIELRLRLGQSFTHYRPPQAVSDGYVNDSSRGDSFAEYTGGGLITRTITYEEFLNYGRIISDFEKRIVPSKDKNKVRDSFWHIPPMIVVPSVDCKPR